MTVRIIGRLRFYKKLEKLPIVARKLIRDALQQGADEIVALAKSLAPVSPGGGTLRDSIGWTWGRPPEGSFVLDVLSSTVVDKQLTLTIYAGSKDAFYARWQEHGTVNMAANPYFFVSYRALKRRVRSRINRAMKKAAKQVSAR